MLKDVLFYYVNMGASQFLKDFQLSYELKKSVELQKKILQRKEKLKLQQDKLPMVTVKNNSEMVNIAPVDNRRYEVTENFDTSGHIRL